MTPGQEAAAMQGLATNLAFPLADRLQCALQALDWYEAEVERLRPVVDAAEASVDELKALGARHGSPWFQDHTLALVAAVDAYRAGGEP